MALELTKRNQEVCKSIEDYITSVTDSKDTINSIATAMAALKAEIVANADSYYNADDVTYINGKIDAFKTLITNLNTTVQAL